MLFTQSLIPNNTFSIYYEKASLGNSYIYFGGYVAPKGGSISNITFYNLVSSGSNAGLWALTGKTAKYGGQLDDLG